MGVPPEPRRASRYEGKANAVLGQACAAVPAAQPRLDVVTWLCCVSPESRAIPVVPRAPGSILGLHLSCDRGLHHHS